MSFSLRRVLFVSVIAWALMFLVTEDCRGLLTESYLKLEV